MTVEDSIRQGEKWLNAHFPDWRTLVSSKISITPENVATAINNAARANPSEMGREFLRYAWKIIDGTDDVPPVVPRSARALSTPLRRLVRAVVVETVGSVLSYGEAFGFPAGGIVEDVYDDFPDLEQ